MPTRPRMIVAGAPEHVGRHLLDAIRADYQVYGMANCLQSECGAPNHPNITWFDVDVADRVAVEESFRSIGEDGGVDLVIYLTYPGDPLFVLGPLEIREQGLEKALLMTIKANAILLAVIALFATSTVAALGYGLSALRLPEKLCL